jgi:3-oxoacyl-[acyl-carrier-protein] synthase I
MRRVYFGADQIITSLGFTTEDNVRQIAAGISGIKANEDLTLSPYPVSFSAVSTSELEERFRATSKGVVSQPASHFSSLEKMLYLSLDGVITASGVDPSDPRTIMIISTTKGNIDRLGRPPVETGGNSRVHLWEMAVTIARLFDCSNAPIVVSNACTSGSVAIINAARLIASGKYDHAIVAGGDVVTEFVISGFQSFQALSPEACRPFDADRTGLSLGEGCGAVILSCDQAVAGNRKPVEFLGGSITNDANHISGPSRDGEGLYLAISAAMSEAGVTPAEMDFISAHGTATPYNDEMESLALSWAGLENTPVNSFKGYIGHTLGASGIIETILSAWSVRNGILFKSAGYENNGVSRQLNVIKENIHKPVRRVLKTASGFGGCNSAIILGV